MCDEFDEWVEHLVDESAVYTAACGAEAQELPLVADAIDSESGIKGCMVCHALGADDRCDPARHETVDLLADRVVDDRTRGPQTCERLQKVEHGLLPQLVAHVLHLAILEGLVPLGAKFGHFNGEQG